ncbi:epimerase [Bacterioplanes sanyensis]|uniref:Epimerase n=1 Tax=Bacterioplanes sanyensis TaxID=1249553 RepID=A0A222FPL5_9GAMM|nr:SDR family NAD(P)-dependent oxidoreductase [Bacterioplanes sanyensis]ASP40937.1 epimerase [Bacterioplanes sanyensis]
MANYLITGGCGFIGSHLADRLLAAGHRVRILDDLSSGHMANVSPACDVIVGDVTDADTVQHCMRNMDGCFHLAAVASVQRSNEEWARTHQINLTGSVNVFDAAKQQKTPVVYASSAAVYGDNADMPLREVSSVRPLTAYGADKLGSELHARVAALMHDIPNVGLRFFNVFGPRQDPSSPYSGVISIFVDRLLKQQPLTIFGDGEQTRDFIYVADVVSFLVAAMDKADTTHPVFNVCTGQCITINQMARMLLTLTSSNAGIRHMKARQGDIRVSIGNPSKANRELGVVAQYSVLEGLRKLVLESGHRERVA